MRLGRPAQWEKQAARPRPSAVQVEIPAAVRLAAQALEQERPSA